MTGNIVWKLLVLRSDKSEDFQTLRCVRQQDKNEINPYRTNVENRVSS